MLTMNFIINCLRKQLTRLFKPFGLKYNVKIRKTSYVESSIDSTTPQGVFKIILMRVWKDLVH
jgi:hypothetical protein